MINTDLFKQIQQFVVSDRGKYRFPLTPEITLEEDLKITGDDADEFIIAFGKEFNVDISEFDFSKYFDAEGQGCLNLFFWKPPNKAPITLGDLYNAVIAGKLL